MRKFSPQQSQFISCKDKVGMGLAAAGSGKTHTCIGKCERILNESDHKIQVLTFSDAAKSEYTERISHHPESDRVNVDTFHSFGSRILENGNEGLKSASSLQLQMICNSILDSSNDIDIAPISNKTLHSNFLSNKLFPLLKTSNLSHKEFETICLNELGSKEENHVYKSTKKKGQLKPSWQKEVKKYERLIKLGNLLPKYNATLKKQGVYDFSDMVIQATELLKIDAIRYEVLEKFDYLIVDEFQDTSHSQLEFIKLLFDQELHEQLIVVGDLRQSVYEFQMARLTVVSDFIETYQPTTIPLTKTYRCPSVVANAANDLIANSNELVETFNIQRVEGIRKGGDIYCTKFGTYEEELSYVVDMLGQAYQNDELSDYAVIGLKHRQLEPIRLTLETKGIPYNYKRETNLWATDYLQLLLEVVKYVNTNREIHFFNAFKNPIIFEPKKAIEIVAKKEDFVLWHNLQELKRYKYDTPTTFIMAFNSFFSKQAIERFDNSRSQIDIINSIFFLCQNAKSLVDLQNTLIATETERQFVRTTFFKKDGCYLETCHSAKGKEFNHVIIVDNVKNGWHPRKFGMQVPDYFAGVDDFDANRKALYVAVTRAKQSIEFTLSEKKEKFTPDSKFLSELNLEPEFKTHEVDVLFSQDPDQQEDYHKTWLADESVKAKIKNHNISYSSLCLFENDITLWFLTYIFRIPNEQKASAILGEVIHLCIEDKTNNPDKKNEVIVKTIVSKLKKIKSPQQVELESILALNHFCDTYDLKQKHNPETLILANYKGYKLKGFIDDVIDKTTTDRLGVDYKSGKYSSRKKQDYLSQLQFYRFLSNLAGLNIENWRLHFVQDKKKLDFHLIGGMPIQERIDNMISKLEDLARKIICY